MKKIYLSIVCLCFFSNVFAQAGTDIGDPQLLVGATLTTRTLSTGNQKYGYNDFFKVFTPDIYENKEKIIAFYNKYDGNTSVYDSLVNKEFTCISVKKWPDNLASASDHFYCLELKNASLGTLYYRFDAGSDIYFRQQIKVTGKPEFYCSQIEVKGDKFNSSIKNFTTPVLRDIYIDKEIKGTHVTYTMHLTAYDFSPHENQGFMVLFSDKTKMVNTTASESVNVSGGKFEHTVSVNLTLAQILKFKTATITDFRVAGDDVEVPVGDVYRAYMNCLVNMK